MTRPRFTPHSCLGHVSVQLIPANLDYTIWKVPSLTGMEGEGPEFHLRSSVIQMLADKANMDLPRQSSVCLSQCLGHFSFATTWSRAGLRPLEPWGEAAFKLRDHAHKLAASCSYECTVIAQRVHLHQEAAEAFKRNGEQQLPLGLLRTANKPLDFTSWERVM